MGEGLVRVGWGQMPIPQASGLWGPRRRAEDYQMNVLLHPPLQGNPRQRVTPSLPSSLCICRGVQPLAWATLYLGTGHLSLVSLSWLWIWKGQRC